MVKLTKGTTLTTTWGDPSTDCGQDEAFLKEKMQKLINEGGGELHIRFHGSLTAWTRLLEALRSFSKEYNNDSYVMTYSNQCQNSGTVVVVHIGHK